MTPLEKAKAAEGRVNYCDECEQFEIVENAAYCKVDGKLIHPIMLVRGQGTGAAWNCKKRRKPLTNYDRIVSKTPEELATLISDNIDCGVCENVFGLRPCSKSDRCSPDVWIDWLKQEAVE